MRRPEHYKRFPIILDHNSVMVIHMYWRTDKLEDTWMDDRDSTWESIHRYYGKDGDQYTQAARQFVKQTEEHCCPAFFMALAEEMARDFVSWGYHKRSLGTLIERLQKIHDETPDDPDPAKPSTAPVPE